MENKRGKLISVLYFPLRISIYFTFRPVKSNLAYNNVLVECMKVLQIVPVAKHLKNICMAPQYKQNPTPNSGVRMSSTISKFECLKWLITFLTISQKDSFNSAVLKIRAYIYRYILCHLTTNLRDTQWFHSL